MSARLCYRLEWAKVELRSSWAKTWQLHDQSGAVSVLPGLGFAKDWYVEHS